MRTHALALSLCGATLAIGACAVSTDPPTDETARQGQELSATRPTTEGAAADADGEDDVKQGTISSERDTSTCDYNDFYHCRRAHQGWRWIRLERPPESSTTPPPGSGNHCCVRVGLPQRSRGYRR